MARLRSGACDWTVTEYDDSGWRVDESEPRTRRTVPPCRDDGTVIVGVSSAQQCSAVLSSGDEETTCRRPTSVPKAKRPETKRLTEVSTIDLMPVVFRQYAAVGS
jgi:hypothetical protein